ncbi:MAG: hypothetical protein EXR22_03825 [Flavobacteriaceae bacterium]|nr:hypothetical protein [Flavobacteriaceae bacterium]PHX83963.1 MAG: hypothetical protein CK537_03080 [Flavobacteriales bacterium]
MYPIESPTLLLTLAVAAETLSLVLFGRANTLWRSPGMAEYPQRFVLLRSVMVIVWVHLGTAILAPNSLGAAYGQLDFSSLILLGLGIFGGLGLVLFTLSIRSMPAQLVFFGGSLHLMVAVAVGWLLGELISPLRLVVIALLLAAQIAILWRDRGLWVRQQGALRFLPFLVGIIWGTYFPLYGIAIHEFGFWRTLISTEWGVLILAIGWALLRRNGRWNDRLMWRNMAEQSVLSSVGQALSGAALWWGGVIVHSILTNFNVLVNVSAFRIRFGERFEAKYVLYFVLYVALAIALVWGS